MRVRDYECDIQGIVNNANYLHYLEVGRHEFIESRGVEFADLHRRGIDVVVAQAEIKFKRSLQPRDHFEVRVAVEKRGLRYTFHQEIVRSADPLRAQPTSLMPNRSCASVHKRTLWRLSTADCQIVRNSTKIWSLKRKTFRHPFPPSQRGAIVHNVRFHR